MKKKAAYWAIILSSFIIPCSGYVFLGRQIRGLIMLCWLFAFGYITFQLTGEQILFTGRISGALAIWVLTIVETASMAKNRYNSHRAVEHEGVWKKTVSISDVKVNCPPVKF